MKGTMADYFTYFSVVLPLTKEQQEYAMQLANQIDAYRNGGQPLPDSFPSALKDLVEDWPFDVEISRGLWLHSEFGGQDSASRFIQHLLQKFDFAPFIAFEWSHDCSKPLIDAYGGGAAYITAKEIETFSTSTWLQTRTG